MLMTLARLLQGVCLEVGQTGAAHPQVLLLLLLVECCAALVNRSGTLVGKSQCMRPRNDVVRLSIFRVRQRALPDWWVTAAVTYKSLGATVLREALHAVKVKERIHNNGQRACDFV